MIKLRSVVEHIIYQNPEKDWPEMKEKFKGYDKFLTLTGSLLYLPIGSILLVNKEWTVYARYGQQLALRQPKHKEL